MEKRFLLEDGTTLEMVHDETPMNPREEFDNLGTMVCFHRRYSLGDKHDIKSSDYNSFEHMQNSLTRKFDVAVILPLYLYDHSGITMSTTPFECKWDSGPVGFIYVSKETARKEYNVKRLTKKTLDKITKVLLGEVETYDQYLTGDVYGYKILNSDGEEIDSVWGFFGDDVHKNGMVGNLNSAILQEL